MKLKQARRKKYCHAGHTDPFPVTTNNEQQILYTGYFNGMCVIINDPKQMNSINSKGFFGKANLSRSYPRYNAQSKPIIIRKRQHLLRKYWRETILDKTCCMETMIQVNDSDTDDEDYLNKLNAQLVYCVPIKETLNLTLEEAYFLMNELCCLKIKYNKKYLDSNSAWQLFTKVQENFIQNYVVYHYFRGRNWVVKPGLKFGGDFLLYKEGPPHYHASYVVIIDNLQHNLDRLENISQRSIDWTSLIGLNRLTETSAKEIIICQVIWPENLYDLKTSSLIKSFSINTILMRRWIPKQERLLTITSIKYNWTNQMAHCYCAFMT